MKLIISVMALGMSLCASAWAADVLPFIPLTDVSGKSVITGARHASAWTDNVRLTAGTNEAYTIPSGAALLILGYETGVDVWISGSGVNATKAVSDDSSGNASKVNPAALGVGGLNTINLWSNSTTTVSIEAFKLTN